MTLVSFLIVLILILALALIWALMEISVLNRTAKMVDEFRENDRKFYRGWENIWFQFLSNPPTSAPKRIVKGRPPLSSKKKVKK